MKECVDTFFETPLLVVAEGAFFLSKSVDQNLKSKQCLEDHKIIQQTLEVKTQLYYYIYI